MEPDDLLCSRNARPRKALVGRAQWKINQPPSLRDNERAWREHYRNVHVRRAQSRAALATPSNTREEEEEREKKEREAWQFPALAQRAVADSPRWTSAAEIYKLASKIWAELAWSYSS